MHLHLLRDELGVLAARFSHELLVAPLVRVRVRARVRIRVGVRARVRVGVGVGVGVT